MGRVRGARRAGFIIYRGKRCGVESLERPATCTAKSHNYSRTEPSHRHALLPRKTHNRYVRLAPVVVAPAVVERMEGKQVVSLEYINRRQRRTSRSPATPRNLGATHQHTTPPAAVSTQFWLKYDAMVSRPARAGDVQIGWPGTPGKEGRWAQCSLCPLAKGSWTTRGGPLMVGGTGFPLRSSTRAAKDLAPMAHGSNNSTPRGMPRRADGGILDTRNAAQRGGMII